jgi:hypothetical protein
MKFQLMMYFSVTGQVERVSDHPVTIGTFNDIYVGEPSVS